MAEFTFGIECGLELISQLFIKRTLEELLSSHSYAFSQTRNDSWQSLHLLTKWSDAKSSQWRFWFAVSIPVPLHKGQTLPSAAMIAARMNSERLGMPLIASSKSLSTLNVTISCFFFIWSNPHLMSFDESNGINKYYWPSILLCITICQVHFQDVY